MRKLNTIPPYLFGAAKAGATMQERAGTARRMTKLPTTLAELNTLIDFDEEKDGLGVQGASTSADAKLGVR